MSLSPAQIDWSQLRDILGDDPEADAGMAATLRQMWQAVKHDSLAEWPGAGVEPEKLREDLHRLRGVLACWGVAGVAEGLREVEKAPQPAQDWGERSEGLRSEMSAAFAEIEERHRFLAG